MSLMKAAIIWAAVAFAAGFAAFHTPANAGEDVHICTGIQDNARIVYEAVKEHGSEAVPEIVQEIAGLDEEVVNAAQARVLIQGAYFLGLVGTEDVALQRFQEVAKQVCEGRFGQIADRNNV